MFRRGGLMQVLLAMSSISICLQVTKIMCTGLAARHGQEIKAMPFRSSTRQMNGILKKLKNSSGCHCQCNSYLPVLKLLKQNLTKNRNCCVKLTVNAKLTTQPLKEHFIPKKEKTIRSGTLRTSLPEQGPVKKSKRKSKSNHFTAGAGRQASGTVHPCF